ncbi:MAG: hypothetical protein IJW48_01540 [Clostridia bacterium]|nr:hypothetical protein [Clostridia bacterium]
MRAFRKAIALLLVLITLGACVLISCDRSYDEEEVLASAKELLFQAEILNKVYYGGGINYISTGYKDGNYYEADPIHLAVLGFTTIDELKNMTLDTFTLGYSEEIFSTKLSMIEDETGIQEMTRYYQKYDGNELSEPVCIMVYSMAKRQLTGDIEYDYSTLRITGVKRQTVYVTVTATVKNSEGKQMTVDIELNLIEEDNGWRIDNPCYANYSELSDKYGELGG